MIIKCNDSNPLSITDPLVQSFMDLGLTVIRPFTLVISNKTLIFPLLLKDFGAKSGMIIVYDYADIKPFINEITQAGYGFSTLTFSDSPLDNAEIIDMPNDWGWTGESRLKPKFLA